MTSISTDDRFKDAPWYEGCKNEKIIVVGCGGIGSTAMYFLTKTVPSHYYLFDFDTVEQYNVGCQFFDISDIGSSKVAAFEKKHDRYGNSDNLHVFNQPYSNDTTTPIMIAALDNMATRKQMFDYWKNRDDRELFIDGRLRANLYEVYAVTKGNEAKYEETLFMDSEVDDGPCTFKQTSYFAGLIGARITHILVNYLTNKYSGEEVSVVPFKVSEVGEPFYIEIV